MSDPIGEWVDAAIEAGQSVPSFDACPRCKSSWHGLPRTGCPGAHAQNIDPEEVRDAVLDWTSEYFVRGEE